MINAFSIRSMVKPLLLVGFFIATWSCSDDDNCKPAETSVAGPDQEVSGTSTALAANTPNTGSGTWTIVSGEGGVLDDPQSATTTFTGTVGTTYILKWTISGCPVSEDEVQITFINPNPQLLTLDKTSVINGEIITIDGAKFSANYHGGSQVNAIKVGDPLSGEVVYLTILSRTETQIKAVMQGVNGGLAGNYSLRYVKKPDAGDETFFPSALTITVNPPAIDQFFTSSNYSATNVTKGSEASFGIKNGSLVASDYTVTLVNYNYTTGVSTEHSVSNVAITALGFGGSMDKVSFTIPAGLPTDGIHYAKITYNGATVIGGWGSLLNIQ